MRNATEKVFLLQSQSRHAEHTHSLAMSRSISPKSAMQQVKRLKKKSRKNAELREFNEQVLEPASGSGDAVWLTLRNMPLDVFIVCASFITPREYMRMASVCRMWRTFTNDERLWRPAFLRAYRIPGLFGDTPPPYVTLYRFHELNKWRSWGGVTRKQVGSSDPKRPRSTQNLMLDVWNHYKQMPTQQLDYNWEKHGVKSYRQLFFKTLRDGEICNICLSAPAHAHTGPIRSLRCIDCGACLNKTQGKREYMLNDNEIVQVHSERVLSPVGHSFWTYLRMDLLQRAVLKFGSQAAFEAALVARNARNVRREMRARAKRQQGAALTQAP